LKVAEGMVNLWALTVRFVFSPPDVVHVQFLPMLLSPLPMDFWFVKFCQWRGAKIVLTLHDLLPHDTGDAHVEAFRKLYARVDGIICHSDGIRGRLVEEFGVPEAKVRVIPHGPFFYDLPLGKEWTLRGTGRESATPVMVLWQGILFPYKGVDVLLNAWREVEARTKGAWLLIAGTGAPELLEQVRTQIAELGLRRVRLEFRFIPAEELVAIYRRADVVVYPYRAITTSGALATGLALGKAVVASDLPVFRELLTDRENALLAAPEDVGALAGALVEISENADLRWRLAARVRTMAFGTESWRSIAAKTVETYRALLGMEDGKGEGVQAGE
jgi:glycosyltransferase involved in cell wall biosynthesis